jgi:hypothetical protein
MDLSEAVAGVASAVPGGAAVREAPEGAVGAAVAEAWGSSGGCRGTGVAIPSGARAGSTSGGPSGYPPNANQDPNAPACTAVGELVEQPRPFRPVLPTRSVLLALPGHRKRLLRRGANSVSSLWTSLSLPLPENGGDLAKRQS